MATHNETGAQRGRKWNSTENKLDRTEKDVSKSIRSPKQKGGTTDGKKKRLKGVITRPLKVKEKSSPSKHKKKRFANYPRGRTGGSNTVE